VEVDALVANNLMFGVGAFLRGKGVKENNVALELSLRRPGSWDAPIGSSAIDSAQALLAEEGVFLTPTKEFSLPAGTLDRTSEGAMDVGSRELPETAAATQ
jgi:hypothetical protein